MVEIVEVVSEVASPMGYFQGMRNSISGTASTISGENTVGYLSQRSRAEKKYQKTFLI